MSKKTRFNIKYKTTPIRSSSDDFWAYGVNITKPNHPHVTDIREDGFVPQHFASKVWQSNFLLMDMLSALPVKNQLNVIEIGAGWGALSVFMNKHFDAAVIASDLDENLWPYQQMLAQRNDSNITSKVLPIEQITDRVLAETDLIIASDICYDNDTKNALQSLVELVACRNDVVFLLADIGRKAFMRLSEDNEIFQDVKLRPRSISEPVDMQGYVLSVNPIREILC
ncbi:class I SAM-dependent methyltransferase [Catenovulum sediminis]|uniref:rRNA adenine N-6-methyltransferase family protein n=1 Tax=Catenovulum sediminis TaxID=1740262 RepID=A0ABV1RHG3_9ALTE|nr:rRNA adenine N-6-methyltransferase family protein [Catenovulum sediminis]